MFGTNEVTGPFYKDNGDLKVVNVFPTIQGEGPDVGRPAVFVRLSHCNLRCWFCDTDFDKGSVHDHDELVRMIFHNLVKIKATLIVVTGGEPLLQNINKLVAAMNANGVAVSVETAGLCYYDGLEQFFAPDRSIAGNLIVCSPKTKRVHPKLVPLVGAWKYVVKSGFTDKEDGVPVLSTQKYGAYEKAFIQPSNERVAPIYIQPMDEQSEWKNEVNWQHALSLCLKFGYNLSIQVHKIVGAE